MHARRSLPLLLCRRVTSTGRASSPRRASSVARRYGRPLDRGVCRHDTRALRLRTGGNSTTPSACSRRACARARQLGNVRSVANWTRALGGVALARGDYPRARAALRGEPRASTGPSTDPWGISHSLSRLALVSAGGARRKTQRGAWSRRASRSSGTWATGPGNSSNLEVLRGASRPQTIAPRAPPVCTRARALLREAVGSRPVELGWPDPSHDRARLRSVLGEEAFAEAWEQGRAMTLDEALDYALEEDTDPGLD